jgi:hypothetical protein
MSEEKKISKKEFLAALKDMNEFLKTEGKTEIEIEGLSQEEQLHVFIMPIIELLDEGKAGTLPDSVIEFYNNHLAETDEAEEETEKSVEPSTETEEVEEPKEKKTKSKKTPKEPKPRKEKDPNAMKPWQKPTGKEKLVYDMVKDGKSDAEIEQAIRNGYKGKDEDFVAWRVHTYMTKGKNFVAKEDPEFAEKWNKEKAKIKPVPHPNKKKTPEEIAAMEEKQAARKALAEQKKAERKALAEQKKAEAEAEKEKAPKAEKKKTTKPAKSSKKTKKGK